MIDSVSHGTGSGADLKKTRRQKSSADLRQAIDRLPPHSPEGEQGVLGCILVSPNDCMGECIEKLKDNGKEAFYDLRHQTIYETLAAMFNVRDAIDLITPPTTPQGQGAARPGRRHSLSIAVAGCRSERGKPFLLFGHRP